MKKKKIYREKLKLHQDGKRANATPVMGITGKKKKKKRECSNALAQMIEHVISCLL
jgi:replicative DNA helicase